MQAERGKVEDVLPSDFRGHPHTSITLMRPYALRMQAYAPITHFLPASRNRPGSRAERASKKPYALYAPLLGVGPFFGLFPFKGSAYGRIRKSLESGLGPTAHRHWSLFGPPKSKVHTDFGRFSSESPADEIDSLPPVFDSARRAGRLLLLYAILWPPLTGFRAWDEVVGTGAAPWRRSRRGFAFQAVTSTEIEKRLGGVIVFSDDSIRPTATPQGGPQAIHRPQATSDPLSGPLEIRTGSGFQWRNQARLHNSFTFMRPYALRMQPYAVRMHFLPASRKLGGSRAE